MGTPQIPSVDSDTKQLPNAVRAVQAANIRDVSTPEGAAAVTAMTNAGVSYTLVSSGSSFGDPTVAVDFGTVSYVAGKTGQAKAAGSVVRLQHTTGAIAAIKAAQGFTLEAWVKIAPSGNYATFYAMGPLNSTTAASVILDPNNHAHLSPSDIAGVANVADGAWHHLAYCISTDANGLNWSNGKVYVDGVLDITDTKIVQAGSDWLNVTYLGGLAGGINGALTAMDEVRVSAGIRYSSAFTPPVIATVDSNTIAALRFESALNLEGGGYGARPANAAGGTVTYIGNTQPTTWLPRDRWIKA